MYLAKIILLTKKKRANIFKKINKSILDLFIVRLLITVNDFCYQKYRFNTANTSCSVKIIMILLL